MGALWGLGFQNDCPENFRVSDFSGDTNPSASSQALQHKKEESRDTNGRRIVKNKKSAQRESFWDGYPTDIRGSFARISRPKTSVRALKILEKKNKHFSADIHDPKARTSTTLRGFHKLRSEKLWAEFSFRILGTDERFGLNC